ncbi:acyl-CoA N-acyltransferase [Filobasidium floriforme]|uniref:acyl-CoA N-acyltransferase n=1 Tax=Filobasidium floriforme TaxID=5210 RepID=UPI001E8CEBC7|nr:acyl-CoA N-acyltransferase [Filobasidium floriforme]KAH8080650.1 acyl-CoA N-acyltransferase [Filobasidium floriforme]
MTNQDFHVVRATEADIPDILGLITELAVYEKEPDAVKATPELLKKNIFEQGYANCILAKDGTEGNPGETIGMALYFFNFSTWLGKPGLYLEDLYVTPKRRAAGIGKVLFGHLGRIAKEKDCGRIEWCVLKWNAPSIGFYEKTLGAKALVEWDTMRLEGDEEIGRLEKFLK